MMKNRYICVLALGLTVFLIFGVGKSLSQVKLKDGTYRGRSFKFPATMEAEIEVERGRVSRIKVIRHAALKKYTDMMDTLIGRIIKYQSTEVDSVTGATISSNALKKAVDNAIKEAASP